MLCRGREERPLPSEKGEEGWRSLSSRDGHGLQRPLQRQGGPLTGGDVREERGGVEPALGYFPKNQTNKRSLERKMKI